MENKKRIGRLGHEKRAKAFISLQKCPECLLSLLWKVTLMLEN